MGIEDSISDIKNRVGHIEAKLDKLLELNIGNQVSQINDSLRLLWNQVMEKEKSKDRQDKEKATKESISIIENDKDSHYTGCDCKYCKGKSIKEMQKDEDKHTEMG